ncbi:MAG TPA: FixH family protein [Candidatus Xenobia bacterium]|jgi:RND family efflux transporter MFP subunit
MRLSFLLLCWLCLAAIGWAMPAGPYSVELTPDSSPPGLGDNRVRVTVTQDGHPAHVTVTLHEDMVGMPMRMPPVPAVQKQPGTFEGTVSLPMAGQWTVEAQVVGPSGTGSATFTLTAGSTPAVPSPAASPSGAYRVTVSVPDPRVGDQPVEVEVTTPSGAPVSDAQVYLHAAMPGMALQLRPVPAAAAGPGRYQAVLPLSMVGAWTIEVEVDGPAGRTRQRVTQVVGPAERSWAWLAWGAAGVVLAMALAVSWRRGWRPGLGAVLTAAVLAAVVVGATWLARRNTPPDKTMGMQMDMARPDMGMAPSDLQAAVPVTVETVRPGDIAQTVTYPGTVAAWEEDTVFPRVQGWLRDVTVYAGDSVRKGQVLARLDDPELKARLRSQEAATRTAQARIQVARTQAEAAQAMVQGAVSDLRAAGAEVSMAQAEIRKRQADADLQAQELARDRALVAGGGLSLEALQEKQAMATDAAVELHHGHEALQEAVAQRDAKAAALRNARLAWQGQRQTAEVQGLEARQAGSEEDVQRTLQGFTTVRAQTSGVVTRRLVDPGVLVQPGTGLFRIARLDRVRLQASVAERDLPAIHRGTMVQVLSPTPFTARITSMFHSADAQSHTGTVEALVSNAGRHLVPGDYVVMRLELAHREKALTVPLGAVSNDGTVWVVVSKAGQTISVRRSVRIGIDNGERVEIVHGLSPGEVVVTAGGEGLQDGMAVTPTYSAVSPQAAEAP